MKLAHVCKWTPGACGMYETVHDLVAAERAIGIDARFVCVGDLAMKGVSARPAGDPCPNCGWVQIERIEQPKPIPDWTENRGIPKAPLAWIEECDLIVSHSGLPAGFPMAKNTPRIHVAHGRPRSSYLLGAYENNHVYSAYSEYAKDERFKALVTLWPGYGRYWRVVFPRPVIELEPFVNLDRWVVTESDYDFGGKCGRPNVVITDIWRLDRDPFHVVTAFAEFAKEQPNAKLHIYGLEQKAATAMAPILDALSKRNVLGEICGYRSDLSVIYNAADMLITPHRIATRTVREAMACGLQVVGGLGNRYTPYRADEEDLDAYVAEMAAAWRDQLNHPEARRRDNRGLAERFFNPNVAAVAMGKLASDILGKAKKEAA